MPLVTSGQFAYVYKLKSTNGDGDFAVRCFRGYLGDRDQRYRAIQEHLWSSPVSYLSEFSYAPEGILVGGNQVSDSLHEVDRRPDAGSLRQ